MTTLLRDLIHERTGLYFPDERAPLLQDKLSPLVAGGGRGSYLDFYYRLREQADEWPRVHDALGVQETYFWREMDQVRAVVHHVVPRWVEASKGRPLRIWSVPCATGEEPLTLAMALDEAGWFARAPIELHASDASPAALARAGQGLYRERSFRALPPALRERYFSREGDAWRIDRQLHGRIAWSRVNLVARAEAERLADSPIVFCRNLFIYFSEQSIRRATEILADRMPEGGCLCLGVSESLVRITDAFALEPVADAFVYVRRRPA